jgi:hypothetical protein
MIMIIPRKMGTTCSTHGNDEKCKYDFNRKKYEGKNNLRDLATDGRILKLSLKKQSVRVWTGFIWSRVESSGGLL